MRTKSKKPSKQRKYENNVPHHEKHKLVSAHMSPELRKRHGFRSLPVRVRDEVVIMRGKYKGHKGNVTKVNPQKRWVNVHQATRKKTDADIPAKIHPSNLMIVKIHKSKDRKRIALINRRTKNIEEFIDIDQIEDEIEEEAIDGEVEDETGDDTSDEFELPDEELDLSDEELDLSDEELNLSEENKEPEQNNLDTSVQDLPSKSPKSKKEEKK